MDNINIHYIFINPNNLNENIFSNINFINYKNYHNKYYEKKNNIIYHNYNDICNLLKDYDKELYEIFLKLNPNYAALLADIGRYIILYNYGGIYNDLKSISYCKLINYIKKLDKNIEIIFEEHPVHNNRIRNTNIICLNKKNIFFHNLLQEIKKYLKTMKKDNSGSENMWKIGSGIFINEYNKNKLNKSYLKVNLQKNKFILLNQGLKKNNIVKWQSINEKILLN